MSWQRSAIKKYIVNNWSLNFFLFSVYLVLVACLLTFIGAISLLLGITSNVSGFILPWILMNVGYYFASLGIFISRLASPIYHIGVLKVTAIICYHILMAYFILSVYSYYRLLKRQKILAQNILDLQFQGSNSSLNSGIIKY